MKYPSIAPRDAILLFFVTLFWGLNWTAVRIALDGLSPWAMRTIGLGGGMAILAAITLSDGRSLAVPRRQWRDLAIAGLLNIAGFNIFVVFAQLAMPTSKAAILTFTMPFWAALLAAGFRIEPMTARRWTSLGLGMAGLAVLAWPFVAAARQGASLIGLAYVLGGAVSWAAGSVFLKTVRFDADQLAVSVWTLAVGAAVCLLGMVLFEQVRVDFAVPGVALAMVFHMLLPIAFCYTVWLGLLTRLAVSTATLSTLIIPVFGVLGAVTILGESLGLLDLFGFALILLGLALQALRSPP